MAEPYKAVPFDQERLEEFARAYRYATPLTTKGPLDTDAVEVDRGLLQQLIATARDGLADTERLGAIEAFLNMKGESKVELARFPTPILKEFGVNHHVMCYAHGFMATSRETLRDAIDGVLVPAFRRTLIQQRPSEEGTHLGETR